MNKITRNNGGGQPGFHLDKRNAKLAGVCGGIAEYANVDVTLVRIAFVIGARTRRLPERGPGFMPASELACRETQAQR